MTSHDDSNLSPGSAVDLAGILWRDTRADPEGLVGVGKG